MYDKLGKLAQKKKSKDFRSIAVFLTIDNSAASNYQTVKISAKIWHTIAEGVVDFGDRTA